MIAGTRLPKHTPSHGHGHAAHGHGHHTPRATATVASDEAALMGNRPVQGASKVPAVPLGLIREVSTLLGPCTEREKQPCTS